MPFRSHDNMSSSGETLNIELSPLIMSNSFIASDNNNDTNEANDFLHPQLQHQSNTHSKSNISLLTTSDHPSESRYSSDIALTPMRHSISSNSSNIDNTIDNSNHDSDTASTFTTLESAITEERYKSPRQIIKELTIEVLPALLVSVAGSILAGYILGTIQTNPAFDRIPALFIMVPIMLNLKSNTELNMSTRLSTLANCGVFDNKKEGIRAMRSNMELLLLQSTVVGVCIGFISTVLSLVSRDRVDGGSSESAVFNFFLEATILMASGIGCAVIGSAVIGILIALTVRISHAYGVDPDNIGTPIASSFGDMTTLLILGLLTSFLIPLMHTPWPLLITLGFVALGFVLFQVVRANEQMSHHIYKGWLPLLYAAITSSVAGLIVEKCADKYPGMPALVPVLNGIGGNIGTVFASRLSTSLHLHSRQNRRDSSAEHDLVMLILLLINIPVQVGFLAMHQFVDPALNVNLWFIIVYTSATVVHGIAILALVRVACNYLWTRGYDPDDCVNPFITGSGDMLGTILLALVFFAIA
ncbi:hypothetical protein LPJ66_005793 [Kickxella alabastrina]|uniref:Uncharacterized protein n=1 Tax=Kickxella alabastrina TaxID=61397 RepID=A0ACC1IE32_9FUNG|nr:hypothetical protein LPJ66_005793 [Kickxella alabastrina]